MQENIPQKAADLAALTSGGLAGAAWIAEAEPYLTAGAAVIAILSGLVAIWYHVERARDLRAKRLDAAEDRQRRRQEQKEPRHY